MPKMFLVLAIIYLNLQTFKTSETIFSPLETDSLDNNYWSSDANKTTDNLDETVSMFSIYTLTNFIERDLQSSNYTTTELSEIELDSSYFTPRLSETELGSSYFTPSVSETELGSSYFTPRLSDTELESSYFTSTNVSEKEPESVYFTPTYFDENVSLTSIYTPTNSSDYIHEISEEGEVTSSYLIPKSSIEIESLTIQTESMSDHVVETASILSHLVQTEAMPSHFMQTNLSETHNWSTPYSTSQSQIFSSLTISSTQSKPHPTPYTPISLTLSYNSIYNVSSSTVPVLSHPSSSSVKNIPLVATLSSVAIFLVISFVVLIACLLCRRHRNRRSRDSLPETSESRRIFPFSYLQNLVLRKSSTDSSQPLQTSCRARRVRTTSSSNIDDGYSSLSETAFNGNDEHLETPSQHAKPKSSNFLFSRKRKTIIPLTQKLSAVNEELNDETPVYDVVNKNGKTKEKGKSVPSNSDIQGHRDDSNILHGSDLGDQQNQTMSTIYTQVPYNEIVCQNSESNSPSNSSAKDNQVYSHLRDVERNFENPYN